MPLRRLRRFVIAATLFAITTQVAFAQDERETTVTGYVSSVLNNFISGEQINYINKNQEKLATSTDGGWAAGFNADVRIVGSSETKRQLWFYVETLRGVRSVDVDCSNTDKTKLPAVCTDPLEADISKLGSQAHYILKNASSFEAFTGLRLEFAKPQKDLALYVKGQIGLMAVSKAPGDAIDNHFVGLGMTSTSGKLAGSYFDAGWGRTDLYAKKRTDRWKFDGYVQFNIPKLGDDARLYPFIQTTVDSDFGGGADSIQTFIGVNFEIGHFFKAK